MWQVIYIATSKSEAQMVEEKITAQGYLVKIEVIVGGYQIKVPESEAREIFQFINETF